MEATETPLSRMTVDEARSVMWLRNNHQPLGELLDEGFLNERRLSWAAEKAYNPRLREAAGVLLGWLREQEADGDHALESKSTSPDGSLPAIEVDITVEEARATHWPLTPYKGRPMGELVDTQTLSLKDLGYAIENAWEKRVRQSAAVLTALRLNQAVDEPTAPAGTMRVVSGGMSYAERRQFSLTMVQGLILGGVLGALLTVSIRGLIRWITTSSTRLSLTKMLSSPTYALGAVIVVGLGIGSMWLANVLPKMAVEKLDERIESYRKGQEGEDQVIEVMRRNLDGRWALFRNVTLPGRNPADIDGVLVGPPGLWALEIKSYAGEYRNYGEYWEYRAGNEWRSLEKNPSRQARDSAVRLADFLRAGGIRQWVEPAVVWADGDGDLSVEHPMVAVWTLEQLPDELGNLQQGRKMDEETESAIVEKLTCLCRRQRNEDNGIWS